ncbi:MAG TPA: ketoacyl-ACP synthase III, partial [Firmicutes bacterium]|nr:ketoacyl-ACP synthase III [Bacillota bacterium]
PPQEITNADLEKIIDTSDHWIKTRTGISKRHVVTPGMLTSDLAAGAAAAALADAGLSAAEVDLIIVATVSPDMPMPSTACYVQEKIGASAAAAFDLSAGCTGFIYAFSVACAYVRSGFYKHVLVIGAEVLSAFLDWSDRTTCVLFGDGAGAVVLGPATEPGFISFKLGADGSMGDLLTIPAGGSRRPASGQTVAERMHYIKMASGNETFKFAVKVMGEVVQQALAEAGLDKADLDFLIPHQANYRIIDAARKRFALPEDRVVVNIDRYGNMSSASIPVALDEAVKAGRVKRGDLLALVGFGAGLTWGAAIIRY